MLSKKSHMNIQELKEKALKNLLLKQRIWALKMQHTKKAGNLFCSFKKISRKGEITGGGVLQLLQDGFGFLRAMESNYLPELMIYISRAKYEDLV